MARDNGGIWTDAQDNPPYPEPFPVPDDDGEE